MDYNRRVQECADAAAALLDAAGRPEQNHLLGNVTNKEYAALRSRLSGAPARRAEHYFTESERVRHGVAAWREGDIETVGRLMIESGRSSIENYECGSEPLIHLYRILAETEGVYGTRFSGAGFRGCCVALADPQAADVAVPRIRQAYAARYPDLAQDAPVYICGTDDGARIL
jgi:galacturonokinase